MEFSLIDSMNLLAAGWLDPSYWWGVAQVIIGLGLVIFVHELGHFLVAKACGVKAEKFYVGFDFFDIKIGDRVTAGQSLASLIAMDVIPHERIDIPAPISGLVLSTNVEKYVRPGDSIAKIVGTEVLESRKGGYLLED